MPNLFTARADLVFRAILVAACFGVVGATWALFVVGNPHLQPAMGFVSTQPVMFSHEHHVGRLGLDCRYCHANTEESDFAGMPSPETCMNCHLQLYTTEPMLQPVRDAWSAAKPVAWSRVYRLPDFVRFSHKVHVSNGVACVSCHDRLDEQSLTELSAPLTMGWCLDCHRHPRLVDSDVFSPAASPHSVAATSVDRHELLTNCSACHY